MFERKEITQKKLSSHNTTVITTTAFRIDLMELAIGMKRFTSHRRTPTTIRVMTTWSNGMLFLPSVFPVEAVYRSAPAVLRRGVSILESAQTTFYTDSYRRRAFFIFGSVLKPCCCGNRAPPAGIVVSSPQVVVAI